MLGPYGEFQAGSIAPSGGRGHNDPGVRVMRRAIGVFQAQRRRAQFRRLLAKLARRPQGLLDLDEVRQTKTVEGMYDAGCQTVDLRQVRGSECRVCDYDEDFLPLNESTESRWAGIYAARLNGVYMPPVTLIQVGSTYYVRDGHHRVSVARTMGEQYIEAHVQVWQVRGELTAAPAMSMSLVTNY